MNIRLVGALGDNLEILGLKPGRTFQDVEMAEGFPEGTVRIKFIRDDEVCFAIVRKQNYVVENSRSARFNRIFRQS